MLPLQHCILAFMDMLATILCEKPCRRTVSGSSWLCGRYSLFLVGEYGYRAVNHIKCGTHRVLNARNHCPAGYSVHKRRETHQETLGRLAGSTHRYGICSTQRQGPQIQSRRRFPCTYRCHIMGGILCRSTPFRRQIQHVVHHP